MYMLSEQLTSCTFEVYWCFIIVCPILRTFKMYKCIDVGAQSLAVRLYHVTDAGSGSECPLSFDSIMNPWGSIQTVGVDRGGENLERVEI